MAEKPVSNKEKQRLRAERAEAALREQRRRERRRQVLTVVGVVVAIVAVIGAGFYINSKRDTTNEAAASVPGIPSSLGVTIGDGSAPHQIIIYEDFLCPVCGALEQATREDFTTLADAGKVQVEYRPFVLLSRLGPYSSRSTMIFGLVLEQDGHEIAKKFHDLLYENQPPEEGPFPSRDDLITLAGQAGADVAQLQAAVASGAGIDFPVDATKSAQSLGINSTPTVFLDGKPFTDYTTLEDLATNLVKAVQ
jgi:protein-disulfide isomerase